jgi:phasin family protein
MATTAETVKNAAETVQANAKAAADTSRKAWQDGVSKAATVGGSAFKDAADKSLGALNEMNVHSKKNLEAVVASVTAATRGAEALGAQAMAYSKTSLETHVEAARKLAAARSVQEVIELQTAWAKTAMEGYMAELNRASETVTVAVKDSMKPLNERATAVIEAVQSAR